MKNRSIQTFTQLIGYITLVALAVFGITSFFGIEVPFVSEVSAQVSGNRATTSANIPGTFNYEGTLREADGTLTNGTVPIVAKVFDLAVAGTQVYLETFSNVNVRDGQFNIVLGDNPAGQDLAGALSQAPLYVELTIDGVVQTPRERIHPVPWALNSLDGIPVGGIIDWWRPTNDNTLYPIPDGFAICDGTIVNDTASPLHGETLPDFHNRFALGSTLPEEAGDEGGTLTYSGTTDAAGEHNHLNYFLESIGGGAFNVKTFNSIGDSFTNYIGGPVAPAGGVGTALHMYMLPAHSGHHFSDNEPNHTHNLNLTADYQPYVKTLKLCRLR